MKFPMKVQFNEHKVNTQVAKCATEVIYHTESVEPISTKFGKSMVVSLVDRDGKALKAFSTSCLEKDLKDFSLKEKWFVRPLGKRQSSKNQSQSYYHYAIVQWH